MWIGQICRIGVFLIVFSNFAPKRIHQIVRFCTKKNKTKQNKIFHWGGKSPLSRPPVRPRFRLPFGPGTPGNHPPMSKKSSYMSTPCPSFLLRTMGQGTGRAESLHVGGPEGKITLSWRFQPTVLKYGRPKKDRACIYMPISCPGEGVTEGLEYGDVPPNSSKSGLQIGYFFTKDPYTVTGFHFGQRNPCKRVPFLAKQL